MNRLALRGRRVRCLGMDDPDPVAPGTLGTVRFEDDAGTLSVAWDNGRRLGLTQEDAYELLPDRFLDMPEARYETVKVHWEWDEGVEGFEALAVPAIRWNGWLACPYLDRANVDRLVAEQEALAERFGRESYPAIRWDGDVLVMESSDPLDPDERIEPMVDPSGHLRWTPGAYSWVWLEKDA